MVSPANHGPNPIDHGPDYGAFSQEELKTAGNQILNEIREINKEVLNKIREVNKRSINMDSESNPPDLLIEAKLLKSKSEEYSKIKQIYDERSGIKKRETVDQPTVKSKAPEVIPVWDRDEEFASLNVSSSSELKITVDRLTREKEEIYAKGLLSSEDKKLIKEKIQELVNNLHELRKALDKEFYMETKKGNESVSSVSIQDLVNMQNNLTLFSGIPDLIERLSSEERNLK